ncbi:hypothetical protein ACFOKI_03400 [Sphingomonas qilianensis]
MARTLARGRYRLDNVWQQGAWTACLEQGTCGLSVAPGKIAYLGTFEVDGVLRVIQSQAIVRDRTVMRSTDYTQGQVKVADDMVTGRDLAGMKDARRFAQESMGGGGAFVTLADVSGVSFSTSAFGKAIKICG